jgi:hypothetical protein
MKVKTFTEVKAANPKMRRCSPVGIIHSGGKQTIFECCLCGAQHTCATSYRQAKHVEEFRDYHDAEHCQDTAREHNRLAASVGLNANVPAEILSDRLQELVEA